jgi:hypothetical protein
MKCEICHKEKRCPPEAHWELRYWLFYEHGEPQLSPSGKKRLGENYIEKLREQTKITGEIQRSSNRGRRFAGNGK